jgi:hypothetical protein
MAGSGDASTASAVPEAATDSGLGTAIDFVTRVVAPASLLTAVLYYFGYIREHAFFAYFGVDLESLRFSTADYLVRSTGTIFLPIGTVLVCFLLALLVHHLLVLVLSKRDKRWHQTAWAVTGTAAAALLVLGVAGLERPADTNLSPLVAPIALGAGAFLLEYAIHIAVTYTPLPEPLDKTLRATKTARRIVAGALLLVSAFWATSVIAEQRGNEIAQAVEASLPVQPEAVVYSRERLEITGPGVTLTRLPDADADAAFDYRYTGLRPLIHSGGHWFLLPAGWTHDNGATVIILSDTAPGIRVDLGP